ncbi:methylenetetrahydrofolate reductase [Cryobacterium breve]|uniref:methylenetetrahydrofolate reductase n=1 Tax=Cryobacterium breve TaxID=1259258 RepID=UPI00248B38C2|nr:methylenetetrahydrofolate reductase [Cryobacterium breve]
MSTPPDSARTRRIPFSFELYPPKTDAAASALATTIDHLAAAGPDFLSVTYGANGSSRRSSLDVLSRILRTTNVEAMAHLTCVGSTHDEANRLIREFLDAGVRSFLALRGDPLPARRKARRSSATSAAPRNSCSSSTGCRPRNRRTVRRSSPVSRRPAP